MGTTREEEEVFTQEETEEFGAVLQRIAVNGERWSGRIGMKVTPLEPYVSRARLLPEPGLKPMPWLLEPQPRLEICLRTPACDIFGDEIDREELEGRLEGGRAEIAAALSRGVLFGERIYMGTIESNAELEEVKNRLTLQLTFAVTLIQA